MKKLLLFSLLMLSACGEIQSDNSTDLPWSESPITMTTVGVSGDLIPLQYAIDFWNKEIGEKKLIFGADAPWITIELTDQVDQCYTPGCVAHADLKEEKCHIKVAKEVAVQWSVYAHELGHCLGLKHSNDPNSIMFASAHEKSVITEDVSVAIQGRKDLDWSIEEPEEFQE